MNKAYIKFAASVLAVVIAFTMIVATSYAWLTMSKSPAVNGINVAIGGGKTILLAPDITETITADDGSEVVVHYPGSFNDTLVFSQYSTYDYLKELSGLSPVSTYDGIYWLAPTYDEDTGKLKDFSEFEIDDILEKGNVKTTENGSYVYLDFWVVSPGSEYELRVSTDTKTGTGSFLIELPSVSESEESGFSLTDPEGIIEASARVGFLVNNDTGNTESMLAFTESEGYGDRYKKLLGVYQEKGEEADIFKQYKFTIYEPNGTMHPSSSFNDGDYIITKPLSYDKYMKKVTAMDISDRLTVQKSSEWKLIENGSQLEQIFQSSIAGKTDLTVGSAKKIFYSDYLQGQVGAYVNSGSFFSSTGALYNACSNDKVSADSISQNIEISGATDDVFITSLERNTPQRIRMFIWIEGQDVDCMNSSSVNPSGFSLSLELSGATNE